MQTLLLALRLKLAEPLSHLVDEELPAWVCILARLSQYLEKFRYAGDRLRKETDVNVSVDYYTARRLKFGALRTPQHLQQLRHAGSRLRNRNNRCHIRDS